MLQVHEKRITLPHSSSIRIFVFGDSQIGAKGFDENMWSAFEREFKSTKNAYAIGLGDYSDFLRPTMRSKITGALSGDRSAQEELDEIVRESTKTLIKRMSFLKGHIIGLHSGHHEWEFLDGTNTTQQICQGLGATYLYWTAYTVLKFQSGKKGVSSTSAMKIFSTHGSGGGSFSSSDLGNLEKKIAPYWVADLYLRGHSSKLEMIPIELNDVTLKGPIPRMVKKTRWAVNVGGFMAGYVNGPASYVERNSMPPACLGWAHIDVKFGNKVSADGKRLTGISIQPTLRSPNLITME
jgi:hypothetical protein